MLTNPAIFFIIIWSFILLLYLIQLSLVLQALSLSMYLYFVLTFLSAASGAFVLNRIYTRKPSIVSPINKNTIFKLEKNKKLYFFFLMFIVISLIEVLHFQNLPYFMVGEEDTKRIYIEFTTYLGSIHFIIGKASMLATTLVFFFLYLKTKKKRYLIFYILVLIWSILVFARSNIISIMLQSLLLSAILGYKIFTMRNILIGSTIIYIFGLLGHSRYGETGQDMARYMVNSDYLKFLPDGFTMIYIYMTQALNNLNYNLPHYLDVTFEPAHQFLGYIPKPIRTEFDIKRTYSFETPFSVGNTDTYMNNFLAAYGYYGSLISIFLLFMVYQIVYIKSKDSLKWKMILVVALHNIALSIFSNSIMDPLFFFEAFYLYTIFTNINLTTQNRRSIV